MIARTLFAAAMFVATPAVAQTAPTPAPFTSFTDEFAKFADQTATLPDAERIVQFRQRFATLFPGFYTPRDRDSARYDMSIAKALRDFPAIREKYTAASNAFAAGFDTATVRFRRFFPDFAITMPVYLVHSLGEMDGGTRKIVGTEVMVFGADVIARIHDETTVGPFLDHELFHMYHSQYASDCDPLWCALWQEGLAVYVAARMNPGANDHQLMFSNPRPIRPEVEPRLAQAMCFTRARFDSTESQDYADFFQGNGSGKVFPPRFGYFMGYLIAQKLGEKYSLQELAKLPMDKVRPLILEVMAAMAACPG